MKEGIEFRLQIETCTICNAKCNFCPYPTKVRDKTIMPMALFKKIIDEAATTAHRFDVVILSGIGEPLLDKLLDERVAYVKKNLPKARITIFNNGSLLYPERFETLKRLGVEDFVISLNASNAEQRKRRMGLDDFDTAVKNAEYACAHDDGIKVTVHTIQTLDEFNTREECDEFYAKWGRSTGWWGSEYVDEGGHGILKQDINEQHIQTNLTCRRAFDQIYIKYDGRVTACCIDIYGDQIFGNLNENTLQELYASDEWVQFRLDHMDARADKWECCRLCRERQ